MITTSLAVNQLSRQASDWYMGPYLNAMDRLDIVTYATFLADSVTMQFNNAPAVTGKAAVTEMLSGYWKSFASIEHEPLNILGSDTVFALEALNHYVRLDRKKVTTRAVAITERANDGLPITHILSGISRLAIAGCEAGVTPCRAPQYLRIGVHGLTNPLILLTLGYPRFAWVV